MDIPLSALHTLADFPLSWQQNLFVLEKKYPEMFQLVLLRMCRYHRAFITDNRQVLKSMLQEEKEASHILDV